MTASSACGLAHVDVGVTMATSSPSSSAASSSRPSARRTGSASHAPARTRVTVASGRAAGGAVRPLRSSQRSERTRS